MKSERKSTLSTDTGRVVTDQSFILAKQEQLQKSKKMAAETGLKNQKYIGPALQKITEMSLRLQEKSLSAWLSSVRQNQGEYSVSQSGGIDGLKMMEE